MSLGHQFVAKTNNFYSYFGRMKVADLDFEPLVKARDIEKRVKEIAAEINNDYGDSQPVFIGVLNGCFLFIADLVKQIDIPCEVTFIKLSSYRGGTTSTREIRNDIDLTVDIKGRHVLIIEDIVDTGNTARHLINKLKAKEPASVKLCSLLLKPDALETEIMELKYIGFEIPNHFVVGYGLDYKELGRNFRDVYVKV
jgi:hypoxanthine phosphoribosyltransferase